MTRVCEVWVAALLAGLMAAPALGEDVAAGSGAQLKILDRMSGELNELSVPVGGGVVLDRMTISLVECRYPINNPVGDAYAYLLIDEPATGSTLFEGWMVASSPALNAFDHIRYDVWALRCSTS